jgi:putative adenylate-forming enzyme
MNAFLDMMRLFYHRRFFTKAQIEAYQLRELRKLVHYAREHSPYYAKSLEAFHFDTLDEYRSLPQIEKSILMKNFDTINTQGLSLDDAMPFTLQKEFSKDYLGYYKNRFVLGLSSGTSGNKGLFITDKSLTRKLPFVFLARSGLPLSLLPYRILFCLRVFSQGFNDINSPLIKLHYAPTMTAPEELIHQINARKINILMAPPSLLRVLLPLVSEIKVELKRIVCYAEVLEKDEKQRFETVFKTKVIEIYQASEGQMASACSYGNLHINEDLVYVELLDEEGEPVQAQQRAQTMLVTNLVNTAQPLIRYAMNDLIILKDACPCGSQFRVIDSIVGRQDDVMTFITHDGKEQTIFPDVMSRWIITYSDLIREFRVTLKNKHQLLIDLDCFDGNINENEIREGLKQKITHELVHYDIQFELIINITKIPLPIDKHKMKRFNVVNE